MAIRDINTENRLFMMQLHDNLVQGFQAKLEADLKREVEQATQRMEAKLREYIGKVALELAQHYSVERFRQDLRIIVDIPQKNLEG